MTEGILIAGLIILSVIMIVYYIKSKKKVSKFLVGVGSGLGSLLVFSYILGGAGYALSLNFVTIAISAILGIPGVALIIGTTMLL